MFVSILPCALTFNVLIVFSLSCWSDNKRQDFSSFATNSLLQKSSNVHSFITSTTWVSCWVSCSWPAIISILCVHLVHLSHSCLHLLLCILESSATFHHWQHPMSPSLPQFLKWYSTVQVSTLMFSLWHVSYSQNAHLLCPAACLTTGCLFQFHNARAGSCSELLEWKPTSPPRIFLHTQLLLPFLFFCFVL